MYTYRKQMEKNKINMNIYVDGTINIFLIFKTFLDLIILVYISYEKGMDFLMFSSDEMEIFWEALLN